MKKFLGNLKRGMNYILSRIAALLLITMTILVLYQVFTRYVLNAPSDFTEEIVRYLLIWTGFIGAAYGFSMRQHMALVFVQDKLPQKQKRILKISIDILILVFAVAVLIIGGFKLSLSTMIELSALLGIPRGIVYMMTPISGVFIATGQVVNIWEDFTGVVLLGEEGGE